MRTGLILVGVLGLLAGAAFAFGATPLWPRAGFLAGCALLLAAFLLLDVLATSTAPWRGLRGTLGLAALVNAYLLYGLPWPPQGPEVPAAVALSLSLLGMLFVLLWGPRHRGPAFAVLLLLGVLSLATLRRTAGAVVQSVAMMDHAGASIALSGLLAASLQFAWLAALWNGRRLLEVERPAPADTPAA